MRNKMYTQYKLDAEAMVTWIPEGVGASEGRCKGDKVKLVAWSTSHRDRGMEERSMNIPETRISPT